MRITKVILIAALFIWVGLLPAKEGMWIPLLLQSLNEGDMQSMGMKMTAEDIYSVNKSSLKDAIVKFGNGCTGEIISRNGLLLTNHHCGYGQIQKHSSVENDYLTNGFWAMSQSEELNNPGLTVTFIVRIEDVTQKILGGLDGSLSEAEREEKIDEMIAKVAAEATDGTHYEAEIKPFYYGNEYYMFVTEKFKDIRFVGAPPSAIGKFGGDTDNWVWPRHTGDFSLFRIYTAPDGSPAEYAPENIPMKPKHFLPISLKGVEKDDFTMVYGFPARTQEYLTSDAVDMIMHVQDPVRIKLRDMRLNIMDAEMAKSDKVRIQYASKQSGVSNGYKKWKGEIRGLKRDHAIMKKKEMEAEFMKRVNANPEWKAAYGDLLEKFSKHYDELTPVLFAMEYFSEAGYSLEAVRVASRMTEAANKFGNGENTDEIKEDLRKYAKGFFKDYYAPIDQQSMAVLLKAYFEDVPADQQPDILAEVNEKFKGDFAAYADWFFANSNFVDESKMENLIENFDPQMVAADPGYQLMVSLFQAYFRIQPEFRRINDEIDGLSRTYMKALREVFDEKTFYPDANFTLRVAYGKAEGMKPNDGVVYKHFTTLDGIMAKYQPGDREFDVPEKLIELHKNKDYGRYGKDGEMRVCFIASNHTSGGNSGSPVIDGEGNLIGLNFDRNWEGTMSDINYDIRQCRNISVDARYVLFIIDKFAGAGYLLNEMELVE